MSEGVYHLSSCLVFDIRVFSQGPNPRRTSCLTLIASCRKMELAGFKKDSSLDSASTVISENTQQLQLPEPAQSSYPSSQATVAEMCHSRRVLDASNALPHLVQPSAWRLEDHAGAAAAPSYDARPYRQPLEGAMSEETLPSASSAGDYSSDQAEGPFGSGGCSDHHFTSRPDGVARGVASNGGFHPWIPGAPAAAPGLRKTAAAVRAEDSPQTAGSLEEHPGRVRSRKAKKPHRAAMYPTSPTLTGSIYEEQMPSAPKLRAQPAGKAAGRGRSGGASKAVGASKPVGRDLGSAKLALGPVKREPSALRPGFVFPEEDRQGSLGRGSSEDDDEIDFSPSPPPLRKPSEWAAATAAAEARAAAAARAAGGQQRHGWGEDEDPDWDGHADAGPYRGSRQGGESCSDCDVSPMARWYSNSQDRGEWGTRGVRGGKGASPPRPPVLVWKVSENTGSSVQPPIAAGSTGFRAWQPPQPPANNVQYDSDMTEVRSHYWSKTVDGSFVVQICLDRLEFWFV